MNKKCKKNKKCNTSRPGHNSLSGVEFIDLLNTM